MPATCDEGDPGYEQKAAAVYIDGEEFPTIDTSANDKPAVSTEIRTDGPAALTRLSKIQIPARWKGQDIFEALPISADDQQSVPVNVQMREPINSNVRRGWNIVHVGWLKKVGAAAGGRALQLHVADYANIVNNIPVTTTYQNQSTDSILDDVLSRLEEKSNIPSVRLNAASGFVGSRRARELFDGEAPAPAQGPQTESKTFKATDGDTVADVLNWVAKKLGVVWWFDPITDVDLSLNVSSTSILNELYKSRQTGGDLYIHENQALYNIDPINRVLTIGEEVNVDRETSGNVYFVGSATHADLLQNSRGQVNEKVIRDTFSSLDAAESAARKALIEEHNSTNEGEIIADGRKNIIPYNRIEAIPICNDYVDGNMEPLTYQVKRVKHEVPATGRYKTYCNVGLSSTEEDILSDSFYGDSEGDVVYNVGQAEETSERTGQTGEPVVGSE